MNYPLRWGVDFNGSCCSHCGYPPRHPNHEELTLTGVTCKSLTNAYWCSSGKVHMLVSHVHLPDAGVLGSQSHSCENLHNWFANDRQKRVGLPYDPRIVL